MRVSFRMLFQKQFSKSQMNRQAMGVACGVVVLLLVAGGVSLMAGPSPDRKTYQAVFLANGQVYFGKLKGTWTKAPVLEDVFYLQANQQLQQATSTEPTPQFSLFKLGQSEIHAPQDRLHLMKSQMLFWEDLQKDSQVIRTIEEFKKQNPK